MSPAKHHHHPIIVDDPAAGPSVAGLRLTPQLLLYPAFFTTGNWVVSIGFLISVGGHWKKHNFHQLHWTYENWINFRQPTPNRWKLT
jgi:hypothetical protein